MDDPSSVPPPCGARAWQENVDWHAWFRNLGRQTRTLRELLGLSQDRLALLAGVSQGSVSRFEKGNARCTPAIVMLKLAVALARQCHADNRALAEPLVRVLDDIEELVPVSAVRDLPTISRDPQAEQLQILFRSAAPPRAREAVLSIVRAFCTIAGSHPRNDPR